MAESAYLIGRRRFVAGLLAGACGAPLRAGAPLGGAGLPAIVYDQGMGATDASGLVKGFPLREKGAKQLFVDVHAGSANFNGLSPFPGRRLDGRGPNHQVGATGPGAADKAYGPAASYAQAIDTIQPVIPDGEGWQVFLAEGQTFEIGPVHLNWAYLHGRSVEFPFCLQSYDPRDPLNLAKHGRAGTAGQAARPELVLGPGGSLPFVPRGDARAYDNWAFRGLRFVSHAASSPSMGHAYCVNNLLIENCIFDSVQLVLENANPHEGFRTSRNVIVRRVASFGQFDVVGSHSCGIYSSSVDLTIEDSVFHHCGWKIGVGRDAPVSAGGPDMFKHCLYIHGGNGTTATIRRVVMTDASAAGLSLRGNHLCHHNVIIDCPTADFKSGGSVSDTESPDGVMQKAYCHLVIGGADITPALPRGQGFSCSDGRAGSYYMHNLYVNNPTFGHVNNMWMMVKGNVPRQHSDVRLVGNRAYAYAPAAARLVLGGPFPDTIGVVDEDNRSRDASPATTATLYAELGLRDKASLVARMIADPMQDWSYRLLGAASKHFAFDFDRSFD